jgi:hypothetical protein
LLQDCPTPEVHLVIKWGEFPLDIGLRDNRKEIGDENSLICKIKFISIIFVLKTEGMFRFNKKMKNYSSIYETKYFGSI